MPDRDDGGPRCIGCPVTLARDENARMKYTGFLMGQLNGPGMRGRGGHDWSDAARAAARVLLDQHLARPCPGAVPLCVRSLPSLSLPIREGSEAAAKAPGEMKDGPGPEKPLPRFCAGCGVIFTPRRATQKYHAPECSTRQRAKRHRAAKRQAPP